MGKFTNRIGEKHVTNEGCNIEIIEYFGALNCTVRFDDNLTLNNIQYTWIKNGTIKNPNYKSIFGVGYLGVGKYLAYNGKKGTKAYVAWIGMLCRCYNPSYQAKRQTYIGCSVTEEWHCFQNFAKWFELNYVNEYALDKDILFKNNKIYSPKNCCFVPKTINSLFIKSNNSRGDLPIGVSKWKNKFQSRFNSSNKTIHLGYFKDPLDAFNAYKKAKESEIKTVAFLWKDKIADDVYNAMINYKVKETD